MKKLILLGALAAAPGAWAVPVEKLAAGEAIVLDGRFDEAAWGRAAALDRFWEVSPRDHVEAAVRTEARFASDGQALYVAVRAFDPDMSKLRAPFARRDNVLSDQDILVVNIDPVGARKFAHFIRVNPRGSVADGLWNEDSGTEDFSPDFDFEVATGRFEGGWSAEFRIPFSSLRFSDPPAREWSVMVFRVWPREQRYRMSSSRLARDSNCFICMNEPLTGMDGLAATRHLAVTPNATVRGTRVREGGADRDDSEVVPSLDLKWRPRADLVVDATLNPDFSQVELDTPQLAGNTQFALFFPEKRPFFLEGADILEAPMRAIYTRSVADPAWGVRATQRSAGFDGTVLVTRDDGGGLVLLPGPYGTGFARQGKSMASFARGRWQADGMTLGALATDRTLEGGAYNRVAGPDVVWFADTEDRFRAQVLGSWTTARASGGRLAQGERASGHAALADWSHRGATWDQYLRVMDVGRDFRADNGFVEQAGFRSIYSETTRKFRDAWGMNEVAPYLNAEYKTDPEGRVLYQQNNVGLRLSLPRATTAWAEVRVNNLVATRPGGGLRKRDQVNFGVESNPFPWFPLLNVDVAYGDRVDYANNRVGNGAYIGMRANLRPHPRAEVEYRIDHDFIDVIGGEVEGSRRIITQRVQQLLAIWHFGARDSLRTIWQSGWVRRAPSLWEFPVSSHEDGTTVSVVYGHRRGINASFYVGATAGRERDRQAGTRREQVEVFVKAAWTFDVL